MNTILYRQRKGDEMDVVSGHVLKAKMDLSRADVYIKQGRWGESPTQKNSRRGEQEVMISREVGKI